MTIKINGDVLIHEKANIVGDIDLVGNIYIGEGVTLDNVTIRGDFNITCENRLTNITNSVINGSGSLKDCGIHDSFLCINGNSENFIVDGISVHLPRTFNNVMMCEETGVTVLEKNTNVSDNIIVIEE